MSTGSAAKFGDAKVKEYQVRSFMGGLNSAILSFYVRDDQIIEAKNVEVTFSGSLRPRLGLVPYTTNVFDDEYTIGIRYNKAWRTDQIVSGNYIAKKELVACGTTVMAPPSLGGGGVRIFADNNTAVMADIMVGAVGSGLSDFLTSDDGKARFEHWRNTLYIVSENNRPVTFNRGMTTYSLYDNIRFASAMGRLGSRIEPGAGNNPFLAAASAEDGSLDNALTYHYRFTIDRFVSNDFLSESLPLYDTNLDASLNQLKSVWYAETSASPTTGAIDLVSSIVPRPDAGSKLNIYRTLGGTSPDQGKQEYGFFYLGSVDIPDTGALDTFLDDGRTELDTAKEIFYGKFSQPPPSKFVKYHKNRMWYLGIGAGEVGEDPSLADFPTPWTTNLTLTLPDDPYRVYFSEYLEPEAVRPTSFFDIGTDGEPITGAIRFENKYLLIFKTNSMWGVFGGDVENVPGVPDIEINAIDDSVGCIAPETISYGEGGVIFLSNKGVYFYDGSRPWSLKSEFIDPILENIVDERKEKACGIYLQSRKYILSFTDSTENNSENTVSLEYDFVTKTWTRKQFGNSTVYGINGFIEGKRGDEEARVWALINDPSVGSVQELNKVQYDVVEGDGVAWSFKTKAFDCGMPDVIKSFKTLIIRMRQTGVITVDYNIDDGCIEGSLTLSPITCSGTESTYLWDATDLNWQGSTPREDPNFVWGGLGAGGGGSQQDYVKNIPETGTPQPNPIGKRIQFEFSGTTGQQGQEIQGLTIFFIPEMRVSNA